MSTTSQPAVETGGWRRLNPLMLLVHPVNELVRFLPLVVGTFLFGSSSNDNGLWHWLGVGVPVVLGLLRFVTTRYRITGTQIELSHGLVGRRVLSANLDRVRTIELTSSPIHRLLGLSKVVVGTGSATAHNEEKLELDSLATAEARTLRAALLHREDIPTSPTGAADTVLLRFDPRWARYAPLTTSGLVIGGALVAALGNLYGAAAERLSRASLPDLGRPPLLVVLPGAAALLLLVLSLFAVVGYLVTNGGFTVSSDPARRSFHVRHGLLTTRETSLEAERIRGVELHEPLGLRLAGAARLAAVTTGLGRRSGGTTPIAPASPRRVSLAVGAAVLGTSAALTCELWRHGPRARRRRLTRALLGSLPVVGALVGLGVLTTSWWYVGAALVATAAVGLGTDRYRRLGHALTGEHLVMRSGTFRGRRDVLETDGVIGWNLRQSFFQRRAGLVDLVATTAGGKQGYAVLDLPESVAVALAARAVPGLLDDFRSAS